MRKKSSRRGLELLDLEDGTSAMHDKISNSTKIEEKFNKLKDIQSQLKEKHRAHTKLINFFENNEDCPTCQQHIDESFKDDMVGKENSKSEKLNSGMGELLEEFETDTG
jgi:hypothetical protein